MKQRKNRRAIEALLPAALLGGALGAVGSGHADPLFTDITDRALPAPFIHAGASPAIDIFGPAVAASGLGGSAAGLAASGGPRFETERRPADPLRGAGLHPPLDGLPAALEDGASRLLGDRHLRGSRPGLADQGDPLLVGREPVVS